MAWKRTARGIAATMLAASLLVTAAGGASASSEIERLRAELERRDAVITELLRRVEALERHLPEAADAAPEPSEPATSAAASRAPLPRSRPPAQTPAQTAAQAPGGPGGPGGPAEPGAFEVDEEAAERALERTLVESGALLLGPGRAEIAGRFSFRHNDELSPVIVTRDDAAVLATSVRRRDTLTGTVGLRLGLPLESQLELDLPWRHMRQSDAVRVALQPDSEVQRSGEGLGDLRLGMAKTLVREDGGWPELIGRVVWHAPTANRQSGGVALGGGFHGFGGELVAAKRLDPLVFIASGSATTFLERDGIEPGDQYALSLGAFLAASPEASLRLVLQNILLTETRVGGRRLPGSDRFAAIATAGASVILGPGLLFDVAGDFGVTEDAPDYALRLGLTHRFSVPWR